MLQRLFVNLRETNPLPEPERMVATKAGRTGFRLRTI
jgi:hypothetical protein